MRFDSCHPNKEDYVVEDKTLHMTILFDFYGELLTAKQREYFDLYHNEDLSLAEIAQMVNISRNGVHDIIKRAEKILIDFEQKTGLVKRWMDTRGEITKALKIVKEIKQTTNDKTENLTTKLENILQSLQ